MPRGTQAPSFEVWTAPACVGLVSGIGLLIALLSDGFAAQAAGCLAVAAPLLTLVGLLPYRFLTQLDHRRRR